MWHSSKLNIGCGWIVLLAVGLVKDACAQCEVAKLIASTGMGLDFLGSAVDVSGEWAIVGGGNHFFLGKVSAVYLFRRSAGEWSNTEVAQLIPDGGVGVTRFGASVAIDGFTAVVGAETGDGGSLGTGVAHVFQYDDGQWQEVSPALHAADGQVSDRFGYSVAISSDVIVVGAPYDDDGGFDSGSAYVFERNGSVWSQVAKLLASDRAGLDGFGSAVAVDGNTLVIGAPGDDNSRSDAGAVYVFERLNGQWFEVRKMRAASGGLIDNLGHSVAISGQTVVAGAPVRDAGAVADVGAVYVFERENGVWPPFENAGLMASDQAEGDRLGTSVAVQGTVAVAGAVFADGIVGGSGVVYVFRRLDGHWQATEVAKIVAQDGENSDRFGAAVAMDSGTVLTGASTDDHSMWIDVGSAYVSADAVGNGLGLAGPDPGYAGIVNTLSTYCGTPNARVVLLFAYFPGTATVFGCSGVRLDIGGPVISSIEVQADPGGRAVIAGFVPGSVSGRTLLIQAYEPVNCRVSNLVEHEFP